MISDALMRDRPEMAFFLRIRSRANVAIGMPPTVIDANVVGRIRANASNVATQETRVVPLRQMVSAQSPCLFLWFSSRGESNLFHSCAITRVEAKEAKRVA